MKAEDLYSLQFAQGTLLQGQSVWNSIWGGNHGRDPSEPLECHRCHICLHRDTADLGTLCFRTIILLCIRQVLVYLGLKDLQKTPTATLQLQAGIYSSCFDFLSECNSQFNLICTYIINTNHLYQISVYNVVLPAPLLPQNKLVHHLLILLSS